MCKTNTFGVCVLCVCVTVSVTTRERTHSHRESHWRVRVSERISALKPYAVRVRRALGRNLGWVPAPGGKCRLRRPLGEFAAMTDENDTLARADHLAPRNPHTTSHTHIHIHDTCYYTRSPNVSSVHVHNDKNTRGKGTPHWALRGDARESASRSSRSPCPPRRSSPP